jgi:hypothetical protein
MLDVGDPFSKSEISEALHTVDQAITDYAAGLSPERFFAHPPEVWSVAENVQHLCLTVAPIAKAVLIPREKLSNRFGLSDRPSRRYSEIYEQYRGVLQDGLVAPPQYVPTAETLPPDAKTAQDQIIAEWKDVSGRLSDKLEEWSESELDTYQVPHLLFGLMTMREMLFFTLYHNLHHLNDAKRLVEASAS